MGGIYTIPFGYAFSKCLADGVMEMVEGNPLSLPRVKIFVPNRRSIRSLSEAFIQGKSGKPVLLPQISPLGDSIEEDMLVLESETGAHPLAPAISPMRRFILLTFLIQKMDPTFTFTHAYRLAVSLGQLLDEMQIEGIATEKLEDLVANEFAQHWGQILSFLRIVTKNWPEILIGENRLDVMERRNRLLALEAQNLIKNKIKEPVIIAGSTGSVPATSHLMQIVKDLDQGYIVLPGFDREMSEEEEASIMDDPAHPQYGMLKLLDRLEARPNEVELWPGLAPLDIEKEACRHFVTDALLPANLSDQWHQRAELHRQRFKDWKSDHLYRIDCRTEQEEATIIALLLREILEREGASAALITADRQLARRVAGELRQWSLDIDDSAGQPLSDFPAGTFLSALIEARLSEYAPVPLLTLLKHPYSGSMKDPVLFRTFTRLLELEVLRGIRPKAGLDGINDLLNEAPERSEIKEILQFWAEVKAILTPLEKKTVGSELIEAFIKVAEHLAGDSLWQGEDGKKAHQLIGDISAQLDLLQSMNIEDFATLLRDSLQTISIRPVYGKHPRLFIWGPLEARMQQVDRVILGGLNEGSWPRDVNIDPWLNRQMRKKLGLPPAERRVGQAAHDFYQAMGNDEVFLTRAQRINGTPTEPSRWLLRFEAYQHCLGLDLHRNENKASLYHSWASQLDKPAQELRIRRPAPQPGARYRPLSLSVTRIGDWRHNPYIVFARDILKLYPLAGLDEEPSAAERGTIIHDILNDYLKIQDRGNDRSIEYQRLSHIADQHFAKMSNRPGLLAFWRPAFDKSAEFFLDEYLARKALIEKTYTEISGELTIAAKDRPFTLKAKADRIDRLKDNEYVVIDYKSGQAPAIKKVEELKELQLTLEAALLIKGGFRDVGPAEAIRALEYWGLKPTATKITGIDQGLNDLIQDAYQTLLETIEYYSEEKAFYRASDEIRKSDYAHLSRVAEWSLQGEKNG